MREIGSEFHKMTIEKGNGFTIPRPGSFVFSGRTALEVVLRNLSDLHTVLIPSYCCESMIIPFAAAGFDIKFYEVDWIDGLKIKLDGTADILLWCNYFGYKNDLPEFDGIVIEDITHSLLSSKPAHSHSDYLVASLRKWEPIYCGGYCSVEFDGVIPPAEFVNCKSMAMDYKTEYLNNPHQEKKEIYLQMFENSNLWLAENFSGLSIDPWSLNYISHMDIINQRRIRKENAHLLYEELSGKVQFMFPELDMDCPLFVPILLPNRDKVRAFLTNNDIYCPIHWPKPKGAESNIYDLELSLICDQRYGIEDMGRIVSTLKNVI